MSSTNILYPDLKEFISFNDEFIDPIINTKTAAYYILTNTNNKYILNNNSIISKNIEINVFAVGGGGAGGLQYGNGGNGGNIIYSKLIANVNDILELSVGKGAFYTTNNIKVNGLQGTLYNGYISNIFSNENSYIMNMRQVDLSTLGLNKQWDRTIDNLSSIETITSGDIIPIIFKEPNDTVNYYDDRFIYNNVYCKSTETYTCKNDYIIQKTGLLYDRNYTLELNGTFISPIAGTVEFVFTASKQGILFLYNNDDITTNKFSYDLGLYNKYKQGDNWILSENNTSILKRENVKMNEEFTIKIIHTQDSIPSMYENNLNLIVKITTTDGKIIEYSDTKLLEIFKYNNVYNNISSIYSTPSIIYNKNNKKVLIIANGGTSGDNNVNTLINGYGGCSYYQSSNITKNCLYTNATNTKRSIKGADGIFLPADFKDLETFGYNKNYLFGSGGGGCYLKANGTGGKGGINAGNGINFNNIPSLTNPVKNTGSGAGGNSFIENVLLESFLNKLNGADGIIILKINKINDFVLIQNFANFHNTIDLYNSNIEDIYKSNKINITDKDSILTLVKQTDMENYKNLINKFLIIYALFSLLMSKYVLIKDKFKYQIKIIYDNLKESVFIDGNYCIFNLYNPTVDIENLLINDLFILNENGKGYFIYVENNKYKSIILSSSSLTNEYCKAYLQYSINELIHPSNIHILLENIYKNYFNFYKYGLNYKFYSLIVNDYITNNNESLAVNNILKLTSIIDETNKKLFEIDNKYYDNETDVTLQNKMKYIEKSYTLNDTNAIKSKKIEIINDKINNEMRDYGLKKSINSANNINTYIVYIISLIIVIIFAFSFIGLETTVRPFILLILLAVIILIILYLTFTTNTDFNSFETFDCANINSSLNYVNTELIKDNLCKNQYGSEIPSNVSLPYYYISQNTDSSKYILLEPKNDILVDIFLYGSQFVSGVKIYQPNINIYKNVLLPKNYTYKIYNNKIEKINGTDSIVIIDANSIIRTSGNNDNNVLKIYNCQFNRFDICDTNFIKKYLQNFEITNTKTGQYLYTIRKNLSGYILTADDYDFYGSDNYNNYSLEGIKLNNIKFGFITIKVIDDNYSIETKKISNAIHTYKSSMENLELNINLYLLQKNTKNLYDFSNNYLKKNNVYYDRIYNKQKNIYTTTRGGYNIMRRDSKTRYYYNICLLLILSVIICCAIIYNYFPNELFKILLLCFILLIVVLIFIIYNIIRIQHMETNKYYFNKPSNIFT